MLPDIWRPAPMMPAGVNRAVAESLPRARRYLFDSAASAFLGRFIRDCGDLILKNREFAIPPYTTTYVEMDMDAMVKAIGMTTSGDVLPASYLGSKADSKVGYLIHDGRVNVFVEDTVNGVAQVSPLQYRIGAPHRVEDPVLSKTNDPEWTRLALLCGTTLHDMPDEDTRADILAHNRVQMLVPGVTPDQMHVLIQGSFGDVRNVWAALLLLNQPGKVTFQKVAATRRIVRGKLKAFAAHHVVEVKIGDRVKNLRAALHFEKRLSPRRHEVRGHFVHYGIDENCIHEWSMLPDQEQRWTCRCCGGKRTWRKDFVRGDASRGFVTKEYEVDAP